MKSKSRVMIYRCQDCGQVAISNIDGCQVCGSNQSPLAVDWRLSLIFDRLLARVAELTRPTMDPINVDRPIDLWPVRRCGRCDRVLHIELNYCGRCRSDLRDRDKLVSLAAGGDDQALADLHAIDPF